MVRYREHPPSVSKSKGSTENGPDFHNVLREVVAFRFSFFFFPLPSRVPRPNDRGVFLFPFGIKHPNVLPFHKMHPVFLPEDPEIPPPMFNFGKAGWSLTEIFKFQGTIYQMVR